MRVIDLKQNFIISFIYLFFEAEETIMPSLDIKMLLLVSEESITSSNISGRFCLKLLLSL
jgi:hypothetical protein